MLDDQIVIGLVQLSLTKKQLKRHK